MEGSSSVAERRSSSSSERAEHNGQPVSRDEAFKVAKGPPADLALNVGRGEDSSIEVRVTPDSEESTPPSDRKREAKESKSEFAEPGRFTYPDNLVLGNSVLNVDALEVPRVGDEASSPDPLPSGDAKNIESGNDLDRIRREYEFFMQDISAEVRPEALAFGGPSGTRERWNNFLLLAGQLVLRDGLCTTAGQAAKILATQTIRWAAARVGPAGWSPEQCEALYTNIVLLSGMPTSMRAAGTFSDAMEIENPYVRFLVRVAPFAVAFGSNIAFAFNPAGKLASNLLLEIFGRLVSSFARDSVTQNIVPLLRSSQHLKNVDGKMVELSADELRSRERWRNPVVGALYATWGTWLQIVIADDMHMGDQNAKTFWEMCDSKLGPAGSAVFLEMVDILMSVIHQGAAAWMSGGELRAQEASMKWEKVAAKAADHQGMRINIAVFIGIATVIRKALPDSNHWKKAATAAVFCFMFLAEFRGYFVGWGRRARASRKGIQGSMRTEGGAAEFYANNSRVPDGKAAQERAHLALPPTGSWINVGGIRCLVVTSAADRANVPPFETLEFEPGQKESLRAALAGQSMSPLPGAKFAANLVGHPDAPERRVCVNPAFFTTPIDGRLPWTPCRRREPSPGSRDSAASEPDFELGRFVKDDTFHYNGVLCTVVATDFGVRPGDGSGAEYEWVQFNAMDEIPGLVPLLPSMGRKEYLYRELAEDLRKHHVPMAPLATRQLARGSFLLIGGSLCKVRHYALARTQGAQPVIWLTAKSDLGNLESLPKKIIEPDSGDRRRKLYLYQLTQAQLDAVKPVLFDEGVLWLDGEPLRVEEGANRAVVFRGTEPRPNAVLFRLFLARPTEAFDGQGRTSYVYTIDTEQMRKSGDAIRNLRAEMLTGRSASDRKEQPAPPDDMYRSWHDSPALLKPGHIIILDGNHFIVEEVSAGRDGQRKIVLSARRWVGHIGDAAPRSDGGGRWRYEVGPERLQQLIPPGQRIVLTGNRVVVGSERLFIEDDEDGNTIFRGTRPLPNDDLPRIFWIDSPDADPSGLHTYRVPRETMREHSQAFEEAIRQGYCPPPPLAFAEESRSSSPLPPFSAQRSLSPLSPSPLSPLAPQSQRLRPLVRLRSAPDLHRSVSLPGSQDPSRSGTPSAIELQGPGRPAAQVREPEQRARHEHATPPFLIEAQHLYALKAPEGSSSWVKVERIEGDVVTVSGSDDMISPSFVPMPGGGGGGGGAERTYTIQMDQFRSAIDHEESLGT